MEHPGAVIPPHHHSKEYSRAEKSGFGNPDLFYETSRNVQVHIKPVTSSRVSGSRERDNKCTGRSMFIRRQQCIRGRQCMSANMGRNITTFFSKRKFLPCELKEVNMCLW